MADWLSAICAVLAIALGVFNIFWSMSLSKKQSTADEKLFYIKEEQLRLSGEYIKISHEQLKIAQGQIEMDMAAQLSAAKKYVDSWEPLCFEFMTAEEKHKAAIKKRDFAIEEVLNGYEGICQKFLDYKTDRERFEKSYRNEISNLFSKSSQFRERLDGESSPFKAIKKVYKLWNDRE